MKTKDGFIQGYNAQAAVDDAAQIIVAHGLTNGSDQDQLTPLLDAVRANTGRAPKELSADAGYCSEANLEALQGRGVRAYVATGRQQPWPGGRDRPGPPARAAGAGDAHPAAPRRLREPLPIAQADRRAGVRSDQAGPRLPPVPAARPRPRSEHEWALVCTAHNLLKLARTLA